MPKKAAKNGFFYFMLDFKRRHEYRGRTFPGGMQEVASLASDDWKNLPQYRKDYFNHIAKERKNDPRPDVPKKDERRFNNQGISFAELKLRKTQVEEKIQQENNFIKNFVNNMTEDNLREKLIYLVHVNIFCKTDCGAFYPAEISLVKFSMRRGVVNVFHRYIDPGPIAPGYSFIVKDHSEKTHKLTLPFVKSIDGSNDLARLYHEICDFLREDGIGTDDMYPPLFTMEEDIFYNLSIDAVKETLKLSWQHAHPSHNPDDDRWMSVFKVFSLPEMFCHFKNKCMSITHPDTIAFPNSILSKTELLKETYHFELETACRFHRDEDVISFCSRSFVLRWAYIIRDHCADLIGVDLFPKYSESKCEMKNEWIGDIDDKSSVAELKYSVCSYTEEVSFIKSENPVVKEEKADFKYSINSVKRERDDDRDVVTVKREKTEVGYRQPEEISSVKLERDSLQNHVKNEKIDNSIKKEFGVNSIKQEKDVQDSSLNYTIDPAARFFNSTKIKNEKTADSNSVTDSIKTEKDVNSSTNNFIKEEKIDPDDQAQMNQFVDW